MPPQRRKSSIGGPAAPARNPLADEAEHTPPVSPLRDAEWHSEIGPIAQPPEAAPAQPEPRGIDIVVPNPGSTPDPGSAPTPGNEPTADHANQEDAAAPSVLTMELPEPGDGPLSRGELEQLEVCEDSIDALRVAFWTAGRALQIVRDGKLYRADHVTFDDYVEKRWDMQRSYAHKLIRAWPLAARLHPMAPSINEGQIRELLSVVAAHGEDAAVTVYTTLAADVKVTAGKLREAVALLPRYFDEGEVIERLQSWMRGDLPEDLPRPLDLFGTAESRLAALTHKLVKGSSRDPVAAREFAAKLRGLAELIEQQLPVAARTPVHH